MDGLGHRRTRKSKHPHWTGTQDAGQGGWDLGLDALLFAILALAPWIQGGRTDLGRLVYVALTGLLALAWIGREYLAGTPRYRPTGVEWLLLVGGALLVLQCVPLPAPWIARLAPEQAHWLPHWGARSPGDALATLLPAWSQLSLTPNATRIGLLVYGAHALLFLVVCQRLRTVEKVERLLQLIATATAVMAIVGLLQYLSGTERYAWVFPHPSRKASVAVSGPFSNPNHFAHFVALGIGPLIWWLRRSLPEPAHIGPTGKQTFSSRQSEAIYWSGGLALVLGTVAIAGLLTRSRGGILAMCLAASVTVGIGVWAGTFHRKSLLALLGVAAVTAACLLIHGRREVAAELSSLTSGDIEQLDMGQGRRLIWKANGRLAQAFPLLGTGVGSHVEVYPVYYDQPTRLEFTHAESSYLQILTETGTAGLGLVLLGAGTLIVWLVRAGRHPADVKFRLCTLAVTAGLVTALLQGVADFPWHLTGCFSIAVALAAAAWSLSQHRRAVSGSGCSLDRSDPPSGGLAFHAGALLTVLWVGYSVAGLAPWGLASLSWEQYLIASRGKVPPTRARIASGQSPQQLEERRLRREYQHQVTMARHLRRVLHWVPGHARANLRLASLLIRSFEIAQQNSQNAMGLLQIRDASLSSNFPTSAAQQEWLQRAVGPNLKLIQAALLYARRAISQSPMLGNAYVLWGDLAFLDGHREAVVDALFQQGSICRPHDGMVLFELGREAAMRGSFPATLEFWKEAFRQDQEYRDQIIHAAAPQMPADQFLKIFPLEERELRQLMYYYITLNQQAQARIAATALVDRLDRQLPKAKGTDAARLHLKLVVLQRSLNQAEKATEHAEAAVAAAPNHFDSHHNLAVQYSLVGNFERAYEEFHWCLRRRPGDPELQQALQACQTRQLAANGALPKT